MKNIKQSAQKVSAAELQQKQIARRMNIAIEKKINPQAFQLAQ